jgi:signal transduction histidine kinase
MIISALGHIKRAAAESIVARMAKGRGASNARWVWPLALACGVLIFITGSSIYLVVSAQTTSGLVNRALRVQTELAVLLATVRNAESGQRGYLLTDDARYLDVYRAAAKAIVPAVADLKTTIIDPGQRGALAAIEPLVERKFAELVETIRLHDAGQSAEALSLVRTGVGFGLMEDILAAASGMGENEARLLAARSSSSATVNGWLLAASLIGLVFVILMAVVSVVVIRRQEMAYVTELERSNQELDDFAHIASHDLKEPLRGLFNHAAFLLEDYQDKIDEDGVRRLNRLGQLCQRMERLINDLMYFSRLGRADLAVQEIDPNAIISEIQQMMETMLGEKHARIVVPRALPRMVCDKTRVTEVFRNLITNAVKYNDKAEPLVEIGFLDSFDTPDRTEKNVFYVRDNGVGIEPEFHQVIFRIFKRLQNTSDGADTGSGVGLTFVKKIVERHGGRIWLKSEPGRGSVFYFNLNSEPKQPTRTAHERAIDHVPVHSAG